MSVFAGPSLGATPSASASASVSSSRTRTDPRRALDTPDVDAGAPVAFHVPSPPSAVALADELVIGGMGPNVKRRKLTVADALANKDVPPRLAEKAI